MSSRHLRSHVVTCVLRDRRGFSAPDVSLSPDLNEILYGVGAIRFASWRVELRTYPPEAAQLPTSVNYTIEFRKTHRDAPDLVIIKSPQAPLP